MLPVGPAAQATRPEITTPREMATRRTNFMGITSHVQRIWLVGSSALVNERVCQETRALTVRPTSAFSAILRLFCFSNAAPLCTKVTALHYSTASEATGSYTQRTDL